MFKRILLIAVLVAVIAVAYNLIASPQKVKEAPVISSKSVDPKVLSLFEVQSMNFYADSYNTAHIYGEVKNKSNREAIYVLLEVRVVDKEGNLVKKMRVKVKNIPSGQVRSFDIPIGSYKEAYRPEAKVLEVGY